MDSVLVIAILTFWVLLQSDKKNLPLIQSSNKDKLFRQTSIRLPEKEKLITLEKLARGQGSGIGVNSLIGNWKFVSVWKKDNDEEESLFSSLLRVFSATTEFKKDTYKSSTVDLYNFSIITSIKFGILTIAFSGSGFSSGEQPLLQFSLSEIELKTGSNVLFSKTLRESLQKKKSSFALIALEESGEWLSARSQGGELVLWLKD